MSIAPRTAPDPLGARLPSADEAERSVLGAILIDNRLAWQAREVLRRDWFFVEANRKIYQAVLTLADAGSAIDPVTLREELTRTGELEAIGGPSYLSGLISGVPRLENLGQYAGIVREKALLRAIAKTGNLIASEALEGEHSGDTILARAQQRIHRLATAAVLDEDDSAAAIAAVVDEELANPDGGQGILTGFSRLDRITNGLEPGDLWYLAAFTSVGKSALAYLIAIHMAAAGHRVDLLSYEMQQRQVMYRFYSSGWGIDLMHLRSRRLSADEYERYQEARAWMQTAPLRIVRAGGKTVHDIRSRANRLAAAGELDVMIVDYIGLIPGHGRFASRAQEVAAISRELKCITLETGVPMIVLVQINREGAKSGAEPELWWLKDSGGQENDADLVAILTREDSAANLHVLKQRNGPVDVIPMTFHATYARYEEAHEYPREVMVP